MTEVEKSSKKKRGNQGSKEDHLAVLKFLSEALAADELTASEVFAQADRSF